MPEIIVGTKVIMKETKCCKSKSVVGEGEVRRVWEDHTYSIQQYVPNDVDNNLSLECWFHEADCFEVVN